MQFTIIFNFVAIQVIMKIISKYKFTLIGIVAGAIGGYLYYFYVGCVSGSCPITSKPLNMTLYGAMMGGLLLSIFESNKNKPIN